MEYDNLKKFMQDEIIKLKNDSLMLKEKSDNAKTAYKKQYYKKKLFKNNEFIARILMTQAKLENVNETNNT